MTQDNPNMNPEMREIHRKLQEDGIDPSVDDQEKLKHLWQLYLKTEISLKSSVKSLEELRVQQADEMKEVENYVEHIRNLSDEREALTLEFEAENEQLKSEIEHLKDEIEGTKNDETKEMLLQQGLDDIAHSSTSEQIAYLLVERARLMDELESEQNQTEIETPDGTMSAHQIYNLLEQERKEFEQELQTQRDSLRAVKEQMRQTHEEEINSIMGENGKLQGLLDSSRRKINDYEDEIEQMKETVNQNLKNTSLNMSQGREMATLKSEIAELQADNATLVDNIQTLTVQLQEARESAQDQKFQDNAVLKKVQDEAYQQRDKVFELESANQKLTSEKKSLEMKLSFVEKELDDTKEHQKMLNRQKSTSSDAELSSLKEELEALKKDNDRLREELGNTRKDLNFHRQSHTSDEILEKERNRHSEEESTLKNKIRSLERKIGDLEGDLAASQRELWSKQSEYKKILVQLKSHKEDTLSTECSKCCVPNSYRPEEVSYREMEETLLNTQRQLQDVTLQLEEVNREKEDLNQQLQTLKRSSPTSQDSIHDSVEKITMLEKLNTQLEAKTKELSEKLSEETRKKDEIEDQLRTEKQKTLEQQLTSDDRLSSSTSDVENLKAEVRRVCIELSEKTDELTQTKLKLENEKLRADSASERSRLEIENLKQDKEIEVNRLDSRLQECNAELRQLKLNMTKKDEEIVQMKLENSQLRDFENRLEGQITSQQSAKLIMQNQHKILEEEYKQAKEQIKDLKLKISSQESSIEVLKKEIERKISSGRETEQLYSQHHTELNSTLQSALNRSQTAEKKVFELERNLEESRIRQETTQRQTDDLVPMREELQLKQQEIFHLRNQLQDEKLKRAFTNQGSEDSKLELDRLREKEKLTQQKNHELQHMLLDLETKIDSIKGQTQSASNLRQLAESSKATLLDQIQKLQKESEVLQLELSTLTNKYDQQLRRYTERKLKTKTKLHRARELFNQDKNKFKNEIERLKEEVTLVKATLVKETEWKLQLEQNYKKAMQEKRELLGQISEHEESGRDHARGLSLSQLRTKYLEEENGTLQQRIDSLTRQKQNLDRIVREYQAERHKENVIDEDVSPHMSNFTTKTSPTKPNLFDQDHAINALISPRFPSNQDKQSTDALNTTFPFLSSTETRNISSGYHSAGSLFSSNDVHIRGDLNTK